MNYKFLIAICASFIVFCAGCAAPVIVGVGAGTGVYSYMNGELKRAYPASLETSVAAVTDSLASMKINVEKKESDGVQTVVSAMRPDQTPVTVKLTILAPRLTEISVRTGVVGLWDRKVSELIHASIAQRLQ
ncbi:MAG: DUF3568 family protein [Desulfobacterales bacterium]|jgi:hypothetical protein|nr:DUF3568 family protein [Desulfobacterales bacterium]MDD3081765.1 DUF3568 family protein [Desulfobacterales bacterium]MDD3950765.1 DUF3568 family protein [Desulfobacterales bacterium]MDD4463907.1 DUF3568 family protein [Desulfobacterales bacterium]MDY0378410.1 DUF3568 family protein [Desulfobacterales bacterium]